MVSAMGKKKLPTKGQLLSSVEAPDLVTWQNFDFADEPMIYGIQFAKQPTSRASWAWNHFVLVATV